MAYKALYRTYRPSTFEEVVGQQHIVKTLNNALATGKIAHAYLFTGPRGTGKTTMAKIFAKALNCEEGVGHTCNSCKNCISVNEGNHPDVLEIDAASNRGINETKELIEKIKYATILGRKKVYIIDEVHMMTPEAFNALLKTLEEPPEHVVFILATTEPHKILPTILSRCQRFDFTKLTNEEISSRLEAVCEKEGIEYSKEAIDIIVTLADGGMRDALSILDQVLAYSGNKLEADDVLNIFALESKAEKISLIDSIVDRNIADVLARLNTYISKGTDIKRLTNDLLAILKDLLVYSYTASDEFFESIRIEEAQKFLTKVNRDQILEMINIILSAQKEYKNVGDINPLFEITLLKLANTNFNKSRTNKDLDIPNIQPVVSKPIEKVEPKEEIKPQIVEEKIDEPAIKESPIIETPKQEIVSDSKIIFLKDSKQDDHFVIDDNTMIQIMVSSKKEIKNQLLDQWVNIKPLTAHPSLGIIATLLIDAHPLVASNNMLVLEFKLPKLAEKSNLVENQSIIQNIISTVFGRKLFVYGVTRIESVNLQNAYRNLMVANKLPKVSNINLEFEEE